MGFVQNVKLRLSTKGGVTPEPHKDTAGLSIAEGPDPEVVIVPLLQHVGVECEPTVEVGDEVLVGQKVGDSEAYVSAPVHSSVSGEVTGIVKYAHPSGRDVLSVQILSDHLARRGPGLEPKGDPLGMPPEEIRTLIRDAGIVGMGGAGFPTHVKLSPPPGTKISTLIINGAECEPYLTADHRLMAERSAEIVSGAMIIGRTLGSSEVVFAIEDNKPDAIGRMREATRDLGGWVVVLPSRYPMGSEKTLIPAITGKHVPAGGLPLDVGVVVDNVGTASAIFELFSSGMPLVERVITVSGDGIARPANLRVKIGTLVSDVIEFCGGMVGSPGKVIMGGPMTGHAQYTTSVPVVKGTSGIVILSGESLSRLEPSRFTCIRCGRCVKKCPMNLMPYMLGAYSDAGMWDRLESFNVEDCLECGCCAYVCPTKNPLVQLVKVGKEAVARRHKKMEALREASDDETKR